MLQGLSDMTRHKLFSRNLVDTNCPNRFRPQEGYDLFDNAQTHCKHRGQLSHIYDTRQKREPRTQGHSIQGQRKINKGQKPNQIDMKTDRLGQPPQEFNQMSRLSPEQNGLIFKKKKMVF